MEANKVNERENSSEIVHQALGKLNGKVANSLRSQLILMALNSKIITRLANTQVELLLLSID